MHFRWLKKMLSVFGLLVLSSSCGYFMDNDRPETQGLDIPLDCLNNFDQKLRDYFQGKAQNGTQKSKPSGSTKVSFVETKSDFPENSSEAKQAAQEVIGLLECSDQALKFFLNHVRGKSIDPTVESHSVSDRYSPSELKTFLENYILSNAELPQLLVNQLMVLKVALFGGKPTELSKQDILNIRSILQKLKKPAERLAPYMPLTLDHVIQKEIAWVERLKVSLAISGKEIGEALSLSAEPYSVEDLKKLLQAFAQVYEGESDEYRKNAPRFLLDHIEVFQAVKVLFVGPDLDQIRQSQWETLVQMGMKLYGLQLYLETCLSTKSHSIFRIFLHE